MTWWYAFIFSIGNSIFLYVRLSVTSHYTILFHLIWYGQFSLIIDSFPNNIFFSFSFILLMHLKQSINHDFFIFSFQATVRLFWAFFRNLIKLLGFVSIWFGIRVTFDYFNLTKHILRLMNVLSVFSSFNLVLVRYYLNTIIFDGAVVFPHLRHWWIKVLFETLFTRFVLN